MKKQLIRENVKFSGAIKYIIYPKGERQPGDWCVFSAQVKEETQNGPSETFVTTFFGNCPDLDDRDVYHITANEVKTDRGIQYEVLVMNTQINWDNNEDARAALERMLTAKQVETLYASFPNPVKLLIDADIEKLCSVKGIKEKTAWKLIEKFNNSKDNALAYARLSGWGISNVMIQKLIAHYKSADMAVQKLEDNPYEVGIEVKGIGWEKIDSWALNAGLLPTSPDRIKGFFYWYFDPQKGYVNGSFASKKALFDSTRSILDLDLTEEFLKECLDGAVAKHWLHYDPLTQRVGREDAYEIERQISVQLNRLIQAPVKPISNIETVIRNCENDVGFSYSDEQVEGIKTILTHNVTILTALAGSGKTASMYPVVKAMQDNGLTVEQCCLSGRAALNLTSATGLMGKTIHRLLGWMKKDSYDFFHNRQNPIKADMVILDEVSMVGGEIFLSLLKAIPTGSKLVMLGDFGQLEPIGIGNVGHDICESGVVPHIHFTKIFRQAQRSGIITESSRVYRQEDILLPGFNGVSTRGQLQDFKVIACANGELCEQYVSKEYKNIMNNMGGSVEDIIICTPKRDKGGLSARNLNNVIQSLLPVDPFAKSATITYRDESSLYQIIIREGDRVSVIKNHYNTENMEGQLSPIFNGNVGTVEKIVENDYMIVKFPHDIIQIPQSLWVDLRLGYAITTHRAQGIGIPYVIAVSDPSAMTLLSKEMLYTQITRAKKFCVLIGTNYSIIRSCRTTNVQTKTTWLTDLIKEEAAKSLSSEDYDRNIFDRPRYSFPEIT